MLNLLLFRVKVLVSGFSYLGIFDHITDLNAFATTTGRLGAARDTIDGGVT